VDQERAWLLHGGSAAGRRWWLDLAQAAAADRDLGGRDGSGRGEEEERE
jgi:hypothetical protein